MWLISVLRSGQVNSPLHILACATIYTHIDIVCVPIVIICPTQARENNIFKSDAVDFSKGEYGEVDDDPEENGEKDKLRSEGDNVDDDGGIFGEKKRKILYKW